MEAMQRRAHVARDIIDAQSEYVEVEDTAGEQVAEENVSRYMNGLRYGIQDEINMMSLRTLEDSYQFSLKEEENLDRKQSQ